MPGMGRSLQTGNTLIVSSFHTALVHQFIAILVVGPSAPSASTSSAPSSTGGSKEHGRASFPSPRPGARARADGATDPPDRLRLPLDPRRTAAGPVLHAPWSPVGRDPAGGQHLPGLGAAPREQRRQIWSNHPIQAASATVWIQVGLGLWLLVAPRGRWSRFGGLASVGWGLVVWVLRRGLRRHLRAGSHVALRNAGRRPVLLRAGILIALPERAFATARLGRGRAGTERRVPDRHGRAAGVAGTRVLAGPRRDADRHGPLNGADAATELPLFVGLAPSSSFVAAHGWAVNLFAVVALATIGVLLLSGRRRFVSGRPDRARCRCASPTGSWWRTWASSVGSAPTPTPCCPWPSSSSPVTWPWSVSRFAAQMPDGVAGSGVWRRRSPPARTHGLVGPGHPVLRGSHGGRRRGVGHRAGRRCPDGDGGGQRQRRPHPDRGSRRQPKHRSTSPAPHFTLTDQHGQTVSLASLRGHTVALTFLDPVCTSDCPLIAQEFRQTDQQLGAARPATSTSSRSWPIRSTGPSPSPTHSTARSRLNHLRNWYYLTGSLSAAPTRLGLLRDPCGHRGAGAMVAHSDLAFVIDARGRERDALIDDPGPTQTFASSFSSLLLSRIDQVLTS